MTKHEEIEALAAFRASLPAESYLRPWLDNVFAEVKAAILSDYPPMANYTVARATIDTMYNSAEAYKRGAIEGAEAKASAIESDARSKAAGYINRARIALASALKDIDRF